MLGVLRELVEHKLELNPSFKPIKQRFYRFASNRKATIKKELLELLVAGFIKNIFHLELLANQILVRKKISNNWWKCLDYTYLN